MEGILELREVAAAIRHATGSSTTSSSKSRASKSIKRQSNGIDHLAFHGFTRGALDDLLVICDEWGIEPRTEFDAGTTSAVVVPFDSADLSRHATLLSPGLLKRAAKAGVPVVTLDFLFEVVDALKRVRDVCGRGCRAYAVAGAGAGAEEVSLESLVLSAPELGVEMTQEALGDMAEAYSVGVGSLKVFGNEFYGAPSGDEDGDGDGDECSFTRVVEGVEHDENVDGNRGWVEENGKGDHDDEADEERACTTPSTEHTDPGACDVDDLETFAAISSVTPLEMGAGQDMYDVGGGWEDNDDEDNDDEEESEVAAMRALVLDDDEGGRAPSTADARRANGVLGADDIFPGELLVRAPRNGKVRQRHAVPAGRQNVLYTDSMTLRPRGRDTVEIDIKAAKNVAIQCHDRRIIIKPAFFYKLRGEGWRLEFRRFIGASDLPAELGLPKDLDRAELFLSTAVEGCSVQSLANVEKVFVDKLAGGSSTRNAAVLGMETVGDGAPAWFYRHEYDVQSGHVLYNMADGSNERLAVRRDSASIQHKDARRLSMTPGPVSATKSYAGTLEKRRSVLGPSSQPNLELKASLEMYDSRLSVLREQLRSSVDVKLKGSGAGVAGATGAPAGLGGVGALAAAGDTIPAVKAAAKNGRGDACNDTTKTSKSSIVDRLVTATGQGCKEVLEGSLVASGAGRTKSGTFWKTRPFKQEQVKSSCTLKLKHKTSENVTIRVTFAPGKSVPAALVFEHAPKATAEFKRVGMVALKKKSVTQTKHVFHLGNGARVDRFLRVSCVGLIGDAKNRLHAVSYLMVSGEEAADGATEAGAETEDSGLSDSLVSEGVYKEGGAEFRVSMECGDLEGTLAEAGGRKALGVKNGQRVQDAKTTQKTETTPRASVSRQSSVSVWERLSNYKPPDNKSVPQPTMFVPGTSSATVGATGAAGAPASVKSAQSAQSGKTRTPLPPPPPPPPALRRSLLSKERCQFVDGVLGSFGVGGLEAAEMVKNVVFGNSSMVSTLSQERIDDLIECLPSAEERTLFRSLDRLSLAGAREAEYFMAELAAIDNLAAKVETKWFFADFDARAAVVQDASNLISSACREIQGCSKLHLAIRIILSECSETLQGAKLLDVTLLQELKRVAYNAQGSLLHFVAAKLSEAAGSMKVPNLARDLPSCAPASQVALGDVKAELTLLMDGVDEASMAWRADEPAAATIEKRLDAAQSKLASTEAIVTETEADFLECAINSGLDPESIKDSEELFRALLDFSDDLNNAHLENKCIGFLTKSKTAEEVTRAAKKQVRERGENQKQQIKVNERRQSMASMASSAGGDSIELMPSPGVAATATATASTTVSIGANSPSPTVPSFGAAVPTAGPTNAPQPGPSAPLPAPSPSPLSSRVSVEQLMQSARKSKAPPVSRADREDADTESEATGVADELSTPVRNLLRSSRALIDSFDLRKVNSVSPIKYVRDDENDEADDGLPAAGATEPAGVPRRGLDDACGVDDVDDDHLCEMSSPRMDFESYEAREVQKSAEVTAESSAAEEIQPDEDEDAATERPVPAASGTSNARQPTADDIASSIDLGLAAKLLSNADKVKASRSRTSGSSALRRSAHRLPTPQSLRMSQVPVLGSRGRSSRSQMHNAGTARQAQSPHRTPGGYSGEYQLVSKSRSRTEQEDFDTLEGLQNLQVSDSPGLTPEQTKAVQALGEVIRQSLPTFSSIEADKQSGLHIDCNLDLDKILSTIILNAGNTPTGPLARGVRGGNETLFDGEAAEELRRDELQHGRRRRANRKALLEPIVPAPLGMGVSVSHTVSKGISPQTLARSLQSSMRASTSVPAYSVSGQTGLGLHANQRSVKGSIHMPNAVENAAGHDEGNRNDHGHAGATHVAVPVPAQSNLRASKTSRGVSPEDYATQSYSKAVSKDYSKAPAWKEDAVARSDEKFNAKPVFMAGPSNGSLDHAGAGVGAEAHDLARARASASASAAAPMGAMAHMASINGAPLARPEMISEEDLDAIPTPHHGYNVHDDDDAYGLSPLVGGDDSMAKERLGLWGLNDWEK